MILDEYLKWTVQPERVVGLLAGQVKLSPIRSGEQRHVDTDHQNSSSNLDRSTDFNLPPAVAVLVIVDQKPLARLVVGAGSSAAEPSRGGLCYSKSTSV